MEKGQEQKGFRSTEQTRSRLWDCGSSLYDSFELKSFERQLDSAISSRTMSMPHLSDRRQPSPPVPKKSSKISRSFHKLLNSVFGPKPSNSASFGRVEERSSQGKYCYVHDNWSSSTLTAIPEVQDIDRHARHSPPEFSSLVRRSASDRFARTSIIGISCA